MRKICEESMAKDIPFKEDFLLIIVAAISAAGLCQMEKVPILATFWIHLYIHCNDYLA